MTDFTLYSWSLFYASVCTSLAPDEAKQRLNNELPTGIDSEWSLAVEPFATGEPNPCQCPDAYTHKHYLFAC